MWQESELFERLQSGMDSVPLDGLILIRDSLACNGEPVCVSFTRGGGAVVVCVAGAEGAVRRRMGGAAGETGRAETHSVSFLPLSADSTPAALCAAVEKAGGAGPLVLPHLDYLLLLWGCDQTAACLASIKGSRCVVALTHSSTLAAVDERRLDQVADAILSLSLLEGRPSCETLIYKRNGKTMHMSEWFSVSAEGKLKSEKREEKKEAASSPQAAPSDSLASSFDVGLRLKESERRAKEALQLPYMQRDEQGGQGLVGINLPSYDKKVRVGGQIIYTPDEADDLDDEDPDDDLNV